jgi:plastocyanin
MVMVRRSMFGARVGMMLLLAAACRAGTDGAASQPATTEAGAAANTVVIDNFTFSPATLTVGVGVGTTVTWVNRDDVPHTATSSVKPRVFNSGALDTDQKYSFTFKTKGTYDYFCEVHPHMTGTIVVK